MQSFRKTFDWFRNNSGQVVAVAILVMLAFFLLLLQFRHPLALNMDGGYNASNVKAFMEFRVLPFPGMSVLPFLTSAVFGLIFGSASAGIKIVTTISLVSVGWFVFSFVKKISTDDIPGIAVLLGWCVSLAVVLYPLGYLKQSVALAFMVFGLISLYWIFQQKDIRKNIIFWFVCFVCIIFSHEPSAILYLMSSFLISATMLPGSDYRYGRIIGISLWSLLGVGLLLTPWIIPFLSQWFVQLSMNGYKTIIIGIKGLFSFRYQMQVDFSHFDYLHLGVAVFGVIWTIGKWRRLALWLVGFGIAVFLVSLFACEYEWQMRNLLTMFVPLSIGIGFGFYHLSRLVTDKKRLYVSLAVVMALVVFLLSGYPATMIKTAKLARPIVTVSQLSDLNQFLKITELPVEGNLYARHGLRFWTTYVTGNHCGVLYRHWTDNYLAVRKSRGEESLPEGVSPGSGDYILISKTALFPWKDNIIQENRMQIEIPSRAQEYLRIIFNSADDFKQVQIIIISNDDNDKSRKYTRLFTDISYGRNELGWLLSDVPRGSYKVSIEADGFETHAVPLYIEENLLDYTDNSFNILDETDEYLLMEVVR